MTDSNDPSHLDAPELKELASSLDDRGRTLRVSEGLESRLFESSRALLAPPKTYQFPSRMARIAIAACLLIACALSVRLFMEVSGTGGGSEYDGGTVDFSLAFDSETSDAIQMASNEDRENLILNILEARADVTFSDVDLLADDPVSVAFAPTVSYTHLTLPTIYSV